MEMIWNASVGDRPVSPGDTVVLAGPGVVSVELDGEPLEQIGDGAFVLHGERPVEP